MQADPSPQRIALAILVTALELTGGIWIATAWHRYVLLDETPDAILPPFNGRRILVYFGYCVLLTLVALFAFAVLVGIIGVLTVFHAVILILPASIAFMIVLVVCSYRLGIVLPASSVEKPVSLRRAWEATRGSTGALLALLLLSTLCALVLQLPLFPLNFLHLTLAVEIWGAIVGWVALMVGIAILTTLYGHYIEGRAIP